MPNLKEIVEQSPKIQWLERHVLRKLKPDEKLLIVTQHCLVADVINEVCLILLRSVCITPFWTAIASSSSRAQEKGSYLVEAILIGIQYIKQRKVGPNERKLISTIYYFILSMREREQVLHGLQDDIDIGRSSENNIVY